MRFFNTMPRICKEQAEKGLTPGVLLQRKFWEEKGQFTNYIEKLEEGDQPNVNCINKKAYIQYVNCKLVNEGGEGRGVP